jgi:hypothetical protein
MIERRLSAVGERRFDPGALAAHGLQQSRQGVAVLHVRRGDLALDRQAQRIDADMALAALDLLAGIVAARAARFRRLDRLAPGNL